MRSLTVTARLSTPPTLTWPLMLDAVLCAGMGARMGAAHPSGYADPEEVYAAPLPLARVEERGRWWYAVSQVTPAGRQCKSFTNRTPMIEEGARWIPNGSLNVASGPDKRLRTPHYYRPGMLTLTWTCIGDAAEVAMLLEHVPAVGKMRTHGHGWIQRWEVTDGGPGLESYRQPTTRHVPMDSTAPGADGRVTVRQLALTPPYWRRDKAIACWQEVQA